LRKLKYSWISHINSSFSFTKKFLQEIIFGKISAFKNKNKYIYIICAKATKVPMIIKIMMSICLAMQKDGW
jgi:hypothetical protein